MRLTKMDRILMTTMMRTMKMKMKSTSMMMTGIMLATMTMKEISTKMKVIIMKMLNQKSKGMKMNLTIWTQLKILWIVEDSSLNPMCTTCPMMKKETKTLKTKLR